MEKQTPPQMRNRTTSPLKKKGLSSEPSPRKKARVPNLNDGEP
jgi:hypothetical protein